MASSLVFLLPLCVASRLKPEEPVMGMRMNLAGQKTEGREGKMTLIANTFFLILIRIHIHQTYVQFSSQNMVITLLD